MLVDFINKKANSLPKVDRPGVNIQKRTSKMDSSGKRLSDYLREQSMSSKTTGTSATNNARISSAVADISKLIVNRVFRDKDIQVDVYDGKATELVEDYERFIDLEEKKREEEVKVKKTLEDKKTNMPIVLKQMKREILEAAEKEVYNAKTSLEGIKTNMQDTIDIQRRKIKRDIEQMKDDYESSYSSLLDGALKSCKEVQDIINELEIRKHRIELPDSDPEVEIDDLIAIVRKDKDLITQLRNIDMDADVFLQLVKNREDLIKSSIALATSAVFTPVTISYALFNIGKQIRDIGINKRYIQELQEEILICYRIIKDQIDELKESYEELKPDTSLLEDQLDNVERVVTAEFKSQLRDAEQVYKSKLEEKSSKEESLTSLLQEEQAKLEAEIAELETAGYDRIKRMGETIEGLKVNWEERRAEFVESQVKPNLLEDRVTQICKSLTPGKVDKDKKSEYFMRVRPENETIIDKYRFYATQKVLLSLELLDKPLGDSEEEIARYKYDQELKEELKYVNARIQANEEDGYSEQILADEIEGLRRELDQYFIPKYKGLVSGVHLLPDNVRQAVGGADEYFYCEFDNRSLIFLYDEDKDDDEIILANYIKYLVQQMLAYYHPNSMKVNIINPTMSRLFANLQVDMDKIDKVTGKKEKGRPYSNIYNSRDEISTCFSDIDSSLDLLLKDEMRRQTFDELIQQRRLKNAVTPTYNVNILHRVDCNTEFAKYNEESGNLGILNIYLVEKSTFLKQKSENGVKKEDPDNLQFLKNIAIIGEVQRSGNDNIIYLTNPKAGKMTRFVYKMRTAAEENEMSDFIANRAKNLPGAPVLTEEFIDNTLTHGKYWQENAKKFVKLHFGYINGDQSNPMPTVLDENDSVHMFIGGTTGGGKSNVLAVMVNALKMMYPPSQLDIIYFDFKVVEVAIHASPYKMPHCTAMSGTDQASYLMSLLEYCDKEMMKRYALFNEWGVLKLSELIDAMTNKVEELRAQGKYEEADELYRSMPRRTILIVDEAAQAFQLDDSAAVEMVKITFKRIAQLARAAGMHMILVSQDPNKMPTEVLSLLKVRGCTKATPDVSSSVMWGNNICGRSENQFIGFFATTSDPEGREEANQRYVVPLNMPNISKRYSKIAYDMAKKDINRNAVIFDDNLPYTDVKHQRYLDSHKGVLTGNNILLGEEVSFKTKFKPMELVLPNEDFANVAIISTNKDLRAQMFRTFVESTYENSLYWPVYCKTIPEYAPLEFFIDKAKKQGDYDSPYFLFFMAANIIDVDEYLKIYDNRMSQPFPNDLMKKDKFPNDWQYSLKYFVDRLTQKRMQEKDKNAKPIYIFMFDLDKHKNVIDVNLSWKDYASSFNSMALANIHLVYITADGASMLNRNFIGHVLASRIGDESNYPPQFKKIPPAYWKYVNMQDKGMSSLYKPITYTKEFSL